MTDQKDAVSLLKADQQKVKKAFDKFEELGVKKRRARCFR